MVKTGVIGHPIIQSKSPIIHNYWIEKHAINGHYVAVDIAPENLENGVKKLIADGFGGFNVTIPHKVEIMKFCNGFSQSAADVGAVNTVIINNDGTLYGDNTDVYGFIANLEEQPPNFDWTNGAAMVIGAGGAARAVLCALKQKNVPKIYITNRTRENAEILATQFGAEVINWDDKENYLANLNLLVNTSSLGMAVGGVVKSELEINLQQLSNQTTVYDIVYNPLMTKLLNGAQQRGAKIITGLGMLLHQARPAFKHWYGVLPDVDDDLTALIKPK